MSPAFARLVLAVTAALLAVFFLWPIAGILEGGFRDADGALTLDYFAALARDPLQVRALANSFLLACATTAAAALIALPLAWISDRFAFPGKALFGVLILVPMVLPPFVGAIGLKQILGQYGAVNAAIVALGFRPEGWTFDWFAAHRFWGIVFVEAFSLYPLIYLNAIAALANVDPAMEEAAQNLGSTGFRRFRRITLPLIGPGLFAGGTLVFIWAFTELGTPLVFDYAQLTSVQIFHGLRDIASSPAPYALVTILLASSLALYAVGKGLFGRAPPAMVARAARAGAVRVLPARQAWLCTAAFAGVTLLATLPHLGVILLAFARDWHGTVVPDAFWLGNFRDALGHNLTVPAIANSLKFASLSALVDVVLGVAIAYVVVRTRLPGRRLLDFLAMLPLTVPGIVLAFGYLAMAQPGRPFAILDPVRDPTFLLVTAYAVRRLPYVVRAAAAGFQQTSVTLEEAAQNLGAPPLRATFRVTLPLISANVIAGALMAFTFAMLEVSDSLILAQKQVFYPITKAILELLQLLGDGRYIACALGAWAMVFLGVALAGLGSLLGRRLGAIFRL